MKKTLSVLIIVLFATVLIVSCDNEKTYNIGDTGPAGGIIFYDVDADNNVEYTYSDGLGDHTKTNKDGLISSECGWRYLEGAIENVTIGNENTFCFGYYRSGSSSENKRILSGSDQGDIGKGKSNTEALVKAMSNSAYSEASGDTTISNYAAKVASSYTSGGYSDWFLPSTDEILAMIEVSSLEVTKATSLWSSSETGENQAVMAPVDSAGNYTNDEKKDKHPVRPVRRF